ncbi:YphA family membrane protein [Cytobacillus sp. NCCP-133]|uniref:YphA family membrane protein n=1 Tax=Cytobacillus sp. NCCP-133 TaxID=766848 RepID=UPI00223089F9|nr:hypothetical protein [Cytobacillus sp. NCCP-133]GLB58006.1 hypothetical protein NCCP133_01390 [Cytobacillus sp. NCCP-133]
MEGLIFYWFSWMAWIAATFFMERESNNRFKFSAWLLVVIILSPYTISIYGVELSLAGVLLLGTLYTFTGRLKKRQKVYFLFCTFIMMLSYVSFHLFELFDPVWVIFPRKWMLAFLLFYMAVILHKKRHLRFVIMMLGAIQGEVLYALILRQYSFPYVIGSLAFLDIMSLSAAISAVWGAIQWSASYFETNFKQFEREKQKLS